MVPILNVFGNKPNNSQNANPGKLLSKPKKWLNLKKQDLNRPSKHLGKFRELSSDTSKRLIVKQKTIRVLFNTGSSGDLLSIAKGSQKYIPTLKRAVPHLWGLSNGTFITKKVGEISLSFVEYSASKSINLVPDIVEYDARASKPLYDLN